MTGKLSFLRGAGAEGQPINAVFEHDLPGIQGQVALHYWPRRDQASIPPKQLTLFILGNPGLLDYYIPFLNSLHNQLPPTHAILSTSHIGHTPGLTAPSHPISLTQQLEAKEDLITALSDSLKSWHSETSTTGQSEAPKLSLMGHSVGSWFVCELMKKYHQDIYSGYLLFPTVGWIADSWNGRMLWPMFKGPVRSILSMSAPLLRPILPFTSFPPTTKSLLRSPTTIHHALGLARSEMDTIKEPDLEWFKKQGLVQDLRAGLFGVWAGGNLDGWVGREGPMVREALGGELSHRVKVLESIPHAFCLSQEHSKIVADVVTGWIAGTDPVPPKPSEEATTMDTAIPM